MAAAVQRYAERGYTWLKYHLSPFHNCIEQTRAMQEVAPAGFQVHYDFQRPYVWDNRGAIEKMVR